jgi:D-alanyl-D-alanine carboxypeptidase/D-alanyl-D-alanine-endopeptidase (penicillin-binding protein 4)
MSKLEFLGGFIGFLLLGTSLFAQKSVSDLPEYASYSVLVRDLETGKDVVSLNAEKAMISASLMKLVTTSAATEKLGPQFSFLTRFWIDGTVRTGTLHGNLIIEGGGDPTLGSKYFKDQNPDLILSRISVFLKKAGINSIDGEMLIDETRYDPFRYPSKRLWEDMGNYYGAPPSALTWRDNSFEVGLKSPVTAGAACEVVSVSPWAKDIAFRSFVKAASHRKDSAYIYGFPGLKEWQIRGSIPAGRNHFSIKGALPDPGMALAEEIRELLDQEKSINIAQIDDGQWRKTAREIGVIKSPALEEIIRLTNHKSINLFADHLLLELGLKGNDSFASIWDKGLWETAHFWNNRIDDGFLKIEDGSGLSPLNKMSSLFLVQMLENLYNEGVYFEAFKNSLAQNGQTGTLKYMWRQPSLTGKIFGKSGSMQDVLGYAGYYFPDQGNPQVFSIIINHHDMETREVRKIVENYMSDLFLNRE